MPRFHVLSDLHLDYPGDTTPKPRRPWRIPRVKADLILNAGDWSDGPDHRATDCAQATSVPIVTTMGNHDWWGLDISCESDFWKHEISRKKRDVIVLNPGVHDIGNTRIIGCTWWTGLGWAEPGEGGEGPMPRDVLVDGLMNQTGDFSRIGNDRGCLFTVRDMVAIHERETVFLRSEIRKARADGKTVVVMTHFGPTRRVIDKRFAGSPANPYFVNEMESLTAGVAVWIHGHSHAACDLIIPDTGCRVVCNPRGYGGERDEDEGEPELHFRPELVIEV